MQRRTRRRCLQTLGVAGAAGLAGCLDDFGASGSANGDGTPEAERASSEPDGPTVLDPPRESRGDPSHPIHGDAFPSFSLPDPLTDETVSLEDHLGERAFLLTFFFTACPDGACPALLLRLRRAQEDAAENGYADDLNLLAMTFDPERDTPEVLEEYGHQQGADLEAGNWHFLRPASYEEGEQLISETFGMPFQRVEDEEDLEEGASDQHDGDGQHHDGDDGNHDGGDHDDHDHGEYTFTHYNLIVLVNTEGIVERAYPNAVGDREAVSIETIVDDARTVATE
ncbi:SCO family protein [Salinadaptatus halalkaliphilus]|uniref:SCO family protein n=1 Tax=Salinadaptatus halalkaliphilus TaxID=2419781 RepID=A0A4S3TS46_9EURY|nr:SCO family protein [Salinadaptatus halalkaliphilus]THE66183.1 SCO family protein [Salinadaptatus halalkaliphilus]